MPTGYTDKLYRGKEPQSPREFILTCARAFGASIEQRDEPLDVPPRPRKASGYRKESLKKSRARLREVQAWTDEDAKREAEAVYTSHLAEWAKGRASASEMRARYDLMLAHVRAWEPPTSEHVGLKEFMVQQLEDSKKWDCSEADAPKPIDGSTYRADEIARAKRQVERDEEYLAEEEARVEGANKWIADLYDSLPLDVTP